MKTVTMTIPIIIKTAVTSKVTISELHSDNLSPIYGWILDKDYYRADLSPELSTILGTRYLEDQPYKTIKIYTTRVSNDIGLRVRPFGFILSLAPMPLELEGLRSYSSDIWWRKINQNPKSTEFNHDEDAQWFMVPTDDFEIGEYDATVVLDNDDIPRHLVCNVS